MIEFLQNPPTETEVAELMRLGKAYLTESGLGILRRLAFQRDSLLKEVKRLKEGDFTPQEFQNLCHNLYEKGTPCTRDEFDAGCVKFQESLFGPLIPGTPCPPLTPEQSPPLLTENTRAEDDRTRLREGGRGRSPAEEGELPGLAGEGTAG